MRRYADGLLHHGRIDDHRLDTALAEDVGLAFRLVRLGQQPLDPFLADPPAPTRER